MMYDWSKDTNDVMSYVVALDLMNGINSYSVEGPLLTLCGYKWNDAAKRDTKKGVTMTIALNEGEDQIKSFHIW
jgi:hypothetical protein